MNKKFIPAGFLLLLICFSACKKETAQLNLPSIQDYAPMEMGKYIVYQLDSFVFLPFGTRDTTISYQVRYTVADSFKDNSKRTAFHLTREIRKDETKPWVVDNSFSAVNTGSSLEFADNNLKFIPLAMPIQNDFSWKGNNFLPNDPYSAFGFASNFTDDWDYVYQSVGEPYSTEELNFENTITVLQRDDVLGDPLIEGTSFAEKTYSIETYAKGIGLVYKNFLHWEFQGGNPGVQNNYKGFGIKLSAIEHN